MRLDERPSAAFRLQTKAVTAPAREGDTTSLRSIASITRSYFAAYPRTFVDCVDDCISSEGGIASGNY